jgi:cold shock CspA family protein
MRAILDALKMLWARRVKGQGEVWFYSGRQGEGTIVCHALGRPVFVHSGVLRRAKIGHLWPCQKVSFTAVERDDGTLQVRKLHLLSP